MQLGVWGSTVSSTSGVWGRAAAKIDFGAFQPYNLTFGGNNFYDSPRIDFLKIHHLTLNDAQIDFNDIHNLIK